MNVFNHSNLSIHRIFENQAIYSANKPAFIIGNKTLTYKELNNKSNQLANLLLADFNITQHETIAILSEPSEWIIISILAILKVGCNYLPLSNRFPKERIKYMMNDSKIKIALSQKSLESLITTHEVKTLLFEEIGHKLGCFSSSNLDTEVTPDDLAYVMYTSGTTGIPNGVEIPHRGVVRLVCGADYLPFEDNLTFLQLSTFTFDASTFEIWGALLNGHTLVMYDKPTNDFDVLKTTIIESGINCIWLTSSLFNLIVEEAPETLSTIRFLLIGGEALSAKHVLLAQSRLPNTQIINGYGPTESTTFATTYKIPQITPDTKNIPIGRPINQTEVYILDDNLKEVENGCEGELYIGGLGLAKGYRNQPKLTSERFIENPFSENKSERLYRTGDLCRWNDQGEIEFIGRKDFQLKIRGFRVEIGEIENAILQNEEVSQVVVTADKSNEETTLVAYFTTKEKGLESTESRIGNNIDLVQLKSKLAKWLPDYMIPNRIIEIERMPLTINGKIDKTLILEIENTNKINKKENSYSYYEHEILSIWQYVFNKTDITIDSNFTEIGGFSLLGIRLIKEINTKFRIHINIKHLYKAPTIRQLAKLIETKNLNKSVSNGIIQVKDGIGDPLFLLPGGDGDAFSFVNLVRHLNTDKPIYVIEFPTKNQQIFKHKTMSEIANIVIPNLEKLNPSKKFNFIGYSFGGRLAFELSTQLQKKEYIVRHLTIIDIVGAKTNILNRFNYENYVSILKTKNIIGFYLRRILLPILEKYTNNRENTEKIKKIIRYCHYNIVLDSQDRKKTKYKGEITLIRTKAQYFKKSDFRHFIYKNDSYIHWENNIDGKINLYEFECEHVDFLREENAKKIAIIINQTLK